MLKVQRFLVVDRIKINYKQQTGSYDCQKPFWIQDLICKKGQQNIVDPITMRNTKKSPIISVQFNVLIFLYS